MKRLLLLIATAIAVLPTMAARPLTDGARATLITCGPGDDFYTTFGHTALRITDLAQGIDVVYNYGTFDFGTPHFYWKFTRGQLDYCLSRTTYTAFLETYRYEQRAVWEQTLNLDAQEVNNLFVLLETNYQPDYRYYRYDFFLDNCATRVRDIVGAACGSTPADFSAAPATTTYRRYIHNATSPKQGWWVLGVDMLLGLPADHHCSTAEAMFYPIAMQQCFASATRANHPLAAATTTTLADTRWARPNGLQPTVVFVLLFVLIALLTIAQRRGRVPTAVANTIDRLLYIVAGLAGLFLCFMWFFTGHYCTAWNLNLLWASPLLLLVALRLGRSPRWALWLQLGAFAVAAVWIVWCGLSVALLPVVATLSLRVATLIRQP